MAFFQSPYGLLPEAHFLAKIQRSPVSLVMSQRIPAFFIPGVFFA
jgi:hypothetical protein